MRQPTERTLNLRKQPRSAWDLIVQARYTKCLPAMTARCLEDASVSRVSRRATLVGKGSDAGCLHIRNLLLHLHIMFIIISVAVTVVIIATIICIDMQGRFERTRLRWCRVCDLLGKLRWQPDQASESGTIFWYRTGQPACLKCYCACYHTLDDINPA